MKNFKIFSIIVLFSLAITSCTISDEPLDAVLSSQINTGGTIPTSIVGTYKMTAFNTSVPTDLNNDGISSTNQMNETICFDNTLLVLNSNNTFTANTKGVDINTTTIPNTMTCLFEPDTVGTYTVTGNVLTTTYIENGVTYHDTVTISGNTIVSTTNNGSIVGLSGGNPVYLTATITIIYTKQ